MTTSIKTQFKKLRLVAIIFIIISCLLAKPAIASPITASESPIYQQRTVHSPDGTGKLYMGREIAKVMGHQGAMWLERPSRETEEKPNLIVDALDLKPTDVVADIGAGTGYLSFRIAPRVPEGKVLAVDIQPEMLDILNFLKQENKTNNVETILGQESDPNLPPESVDLAIMVDAYHEFSYPREMMLGIVKALKPNGRVVLAGLRQISSPNKAQSSFISEEYIAIVVQPLDKTERHRCAKRL